MGYPRAVHYAAPIAIALCPSAADAQQLPNFDTGNGVLAVCGSDSIQEQVRCAAYINGLAQGQALMAVRDKSPQIFCIPETATNGQAVEIVVKYLKANPEMRHRLGSLLITIALRDAFPCDKK